MRGLGGLLGGRRSGQTEPLLRAAPAGGLDGGHLAAWQGISALPGLFQAQFQGSLKVFRLT